VWTCRDFVGKRVFQSTPAQALQDVEAVLRRGAKRPGYVARSRRPAQRTAHGRDHGMPDRRRPHLHGRRGLAADGQAPGLRLQVETQGSVGARNPLSAQAIAEADVVLLACDIEVATERFAGKKIYRCGTGIALKQAKPR
jgi:PTS system fructose-specific IIC component